MADKDNIDQMSPNESPSSVRKSGVRRINNVPLVIAITALILFTALIAMVAVKRSSSQVTGPEIAKTNTDTSAMVKEVIGSYGAGLIPSEKQQEELMPPSNTVDNLEAPLSIDNNASSPVDPEKQQIRMAKMQQFQEAVKAKTAISISNQLDMTSTTNPPQTRAEMLARIADVPQQVEEQNTNDLNSSYQAELAKVQSNLDGNSSLSSHQTSTERNNSQLNTVDQEDRWKLNQNVQAPRSQFEIRAGSVIAGIMISGVNSDLPGQITGQVSQDVYDTATGKHLLIPQGTRLIGTYSNDVAYGQSAVMIAWQRLGFPDGKVLDIGSMPGADSAGYTGFRDEVNNHYFRLFASALLLSGVTAGISYSQNQNNDNSNNGNSQQPTASSELSKALGQQLGQVTAQMIAKNMNIAPTLEIRPGYRFNIIVVKDLDFKKPYQSFDYEKEK